MRSLRPWRTPPDRYGVAEAMIPAYDVHGGTFSRMAPMGRLRRMVEETPASRERYIDLLRAISIVAVVLGHWLVVVVEDTGGELTGRSALPYLEWAHPITWLVQVVPIFFLVGGYANAASLASNRRAGRSTGDWLVHRAARLVRPCTVFVLVFAVGSWGARLLGEDPQRVRLVVWTAAISLWFLSAYLIIVTLAPVMSMLHHRFGVAVPVVLVVLVAAGDVARLYGDEIWGSGSFVFGWMVMHQIGYFWRENRLPTRPRTLWALVAGGLAIVLVLTLAGPYPVSMINVPGERLHNMSPPSLALIAVFIAQVGLARLVQPRAERWLRRRRPWTAVIAVNAVALTVLLWHMTAALLIALVLHLAGVLPTEAAGTAVWWAWRLPWLIVLTAALAVLLAIFAPVEFAAGRPLRRRPRWMPEPVAAVLARPAPRLILASAGMGAVALGLLNNQLYPATEPALFGIPTAGLLCYLAGAVLLRVLHAASPLAEAAAPAAAAPAPDPAPRAE